MELGTIWLTWGVPILGAVAVLFSWFMFFSGRKGRHKKTGQVPVIGADKPGVTDTEFIRARVYDVDTRTVHTRDIGKSITDKIIVAHGSLGRQFMRYNEKVFALIKRGDTYSPAPVGAFTTSDISPRDVGNALNQDELAIWYRVQMPESALTKLRAILIWSAAVMFIIFMIISE